MKNAKKQLQFSLVGLFTFPYFFIIFCGLLCIKYPTLYKSIDGMIITFVVLLLIFMVLSILSYRKYEKTIASSVEEEIDETLTLTNIIGHGSRFCGNINCDEDVLVEGTLFGDIITTGNVFVGGQIEGNVSCFNIALHNGKVLGDVDCQGFIHMDEASRITGKILHGQVVD